MECVECYTVSVCVCACLRATVDASFREDEEKISLCKTEGTGCLPLKDFSFLLVLFHRPV